MFSISQNLSQLARSSKLASTQRQWQNHLKTLNRSPQEFVVGMSGDQIHKSVEYQKQVRSAVQHRMNINQQISLTQTFDASLQSIVNPLYRLEDISTQASSDLLSNSQREILQQEADQVIQHIHSVIDQASFNGKKLLQEGHTHFSHASSLANGITHISALTENALLNPSVERSKYDIVLLFDASASLSSRTVLFNKVSEMAETALHDGIDLSIGLAITYVNNHVRAGQESGPQDIKVHDLVTISEDNKEDSIESLNQFLNHHQATVGRIDFGASISYIDQNFEWREESAQSIIAVTTAGGEDEKSTIQSSIETFLDQASDRTFSALSMRSGTRTASTFFKNLIETNDTGAYHEYSDDFGYFDIIDDSISDEKILNFNVLSAAKAQNSMRVVDHAIDHLNDIRTQVGSIEQGRRHTLESVWQQEVTSTQAQERYLKREEMKNLASLSQKRTTLQKSVLYRKNAFALFGQNLLQMIDSI